MTHKSWNNTLEDKHEDPLYFERIETLEKENKELTRAYNTLHTFIHMNSTKQLLNERDFKILKNSIAPLNRLLGKRKQYVIKKKREDAAKEKKIQRGIIWLKKALGELSLEQKVKIIYAVNIHSSTIWATNDIEDEFSWELRKLGQDVENENDAISLIKNLNDLMSNPLTPGYDKFDKKVRETLSRLKIDAKYY